MQKGAQKMGTLKYKKISRMGNPAQWPIAHKKTVNIKDVIAQGFQMLLWLMLKFQNANKTISWDTNYTYMCRTNHENYVCRSK